MGFQTILSGGEAINLHLLSCYSITLAEIGQSPAARVLLSDTPSHSAMRLVNLCLLSALWLPRGNSQDQLQGQELLLAELARPRDEMRTQVLAKATNYVVQGFIANKINTMVIRQDCMGCRGEQLHRQRTIVDQLLSNLAPNISVELHSGNGKDETSWDYTLFVVNSQQEFM